MKKTICFLVCCISGFIARAQTPADSVPQDYNGLRETVYLQTSKGVYETGEDLWFKAYAFDAVPYSWRWRTAGTASCGKRNIRYTRDWPKGTSTWTRTSGRATTASMPIPAIPSCETR